ncbi:MAG: TspO/MBR family protein [bacterium]|nr:TspO/MBR family protein [bacterium]
MGKSNTYDWYETLLKPKWAPPAWLFGPLWTVLYIIIAISYGTVLYKAFIGGLELIVALPFALNIVFNFAFIPIQFRLKNNLLATLDILLVVITLAWALIAIGVASLKLNLSTGGSDLLWIALINIPYLLWGLFATMLQITITVMNRNRI